MRRRKRKYRSNPSAREIGALMVTTIFTTAIGVLTTWWVMKKLEPPKQEEQSQPPQLPPDPYAERREGYWA